MKYLNFVIKKNKYISIKEKKYKNIFIEILIFGYNFIKELLIIKPIKFDDYQNQA